MEEDKYKSALERAKSAIKECGDNVGRIKMIESIFPELGESEEEKARKYLIKMARQHGHGGTIEWWDKCVAYLEKLKDIDKQLEQAYKNSDEVQYKRGYEDGYVDGMVAAKKKELEKQAAIKDCNSIDPQFAKPITTTETKYPKFKIGDWVVDEEDNHVYQVKRVVTNVSSGMSGYDLSDGGYFYSTKTNCHLWSIADAKDGDVLVNKDGLPFIFTGKVDKKRGNRPIAYGGINYAKEFIKGDNTHWCYFPVFPATKEQRELLFQKIKEAGYEWNPATKLSHKEVTKKSDKVWSEEDDKILCGVIDEIQANKSSAPEYDLKTYDKFLSWLKSIKCRVQPQPKQEWSEEDEENLRLVLECFTVGQLGVAYCKVREWLDSIKQRLS